MKKTFSGSFIRRVWMICCCALLFSCTAWADSSLLVDNAGLFSPEAVTELTEQAETIQAETGMSLLIVTITDAEGKSSEAYADDYFDENGFYDGALLLIDMDNRVVYISTGGAMLGVLDDRRVNDLLDDAYESVSAQDYEQAARDYLDNALNYIQNDTGITTTEESILYFAIAALAALAIAGVVVGVIAYSYLKDPSVLEYSHKRNGKLNLRVNQNVLVNSYVTTRHVPKDDNNGGGTTTHTSSSGTTHGGGGRSF